MMKYAVILFLSVCISHSDDYHPDEDSTWQTTSPATAGADPELLAEAVSYAEKSNSNALVILHGGRILTEHYWGGWTRDTRGRLYSATKSLVSSLLGQLVQLGEFESLDQKSSDFIPEWQGIPGKQEITLRHHLEMTTGLEGGEQNLFFGAIARNERFFAVNLPQQYPPGTHWTYNNPAYRLLFYIIESAADDSFPNVFQKYLAEPIGMSSASIVIHNRSFAGTTVANYQFIEASALSAARFGLLALRRGKWGTDQVVPTDFLNQATFASQGINSSYGFLWWLNSGAVGGHQQLFDGIRREGPFFPDAPPDLYAALGKDDQMIVVIPSLDLVIVRLGINPLGGGGEAISPEQNLLFGKIARAFGYRGQAEPLSMSIAPSSPASVRLKWSSWYGRNYQMHQSPDPVLAPWTNLGTPPFEGTGLPLTLEQPIVGHTQFFRVLVVD